MTTNDSVSDARGQEQPPVARKRLQAQEAQAATKKLEVAPLTPAQRQRLAEKHRIESVVREKRRARWMVARRKPLPPAEREAVAKERAETRLERSTRALVVGALAVSVALVGFSIHSLVQRNALNRDLTSLASKTRELADQHTAAINKMQTTLEQLSAADEARATKSEDHLAEIETATATGFADVSQRLNAIGTLTDAVNALAQREAERVPNEAAVAPGTFTEREITLASGTHAALTVPENAHRTVLLVPEASADPSSGVDPLKQVAEVLGARGCLVLRYEPAAQATSEESLATAREALDSLLAQPEAAGRSVTLVAYGEGSTVAIALAQSRPEVGNLALLAPSAQAPEPTQRVHQAVEVLGPIDEAALGALGSWIAGQNPPSP